ncbi:MAG: hypothetical protein WD336_02010 [Trueperaceae bacterium]
MRAHRPADHPAPASDRIDLADGSEAERLATVQNAMALTPRVRIPPGAEEAFYRLNRLPERLRSLYAPVASLDPDPDDVEDLGPAARTLLREHVLHDLWIDALYDVLASLPSRVRVRRPGTSGRIASGTRPALLAVRAAWADAWSDKAVLARLRASGSVALAAQALWIHADDAPADAEQQRTVDELLDVRCTAFVANDGTLARLDDPTTP